MFLQGCFCVPRTCLIWDFVCLCIAWIIEPVLIVWGLFGVAILIPGRFIFSLGVEKHLSIALLRPLIITQLCIKQVRSFCHCCSMNNTINKWGLYAIFPQVFLGCLMSPPPLFVHCIGGILLSELACSSARNLISSTPAVHFNTANKFVPSFVWTRIFL